MSYDCFLIKNGGYRNITILKEQEMAISEIELNTILSAEPPPSDSVDASSLEQIATTQKQLSQVKESLGDIIDSIAQNQSMVTKAASFWAKLSMLERVAFGAVFTGPTLAAGAIAHIGILLAISGVTLVSYTAGGIVLDDHNRYNEKIAERLKAGIFGLADVLEVTISALDTIRIKFNEEINKFKEQNLKLTENVFQLTEQVENLTDQVEVFIATETMLRTTKDELEKVIADLHSSVDQNSEQINHSQKELDKVKKDYEKSQTQLSEKIVELSTVRTTLGLEVEKAKKVASTLQGTVQTLAGSVIDNDKQRDAFQTRLNSFLNNKEASFDQVADRVCQAEKELAQVKEELKQSNERYKELLDRQEKQVERLEKIESAVIEEQLKPNATLGALLNSKGLFGLTRMLPATKQTERMLPATKQAESPVCR